MIQHSPPPKKNAPQKPRKLVNKQKSNVQKRFWIEDLLAREVTIFAEKIKSSNILFKIHKTKPKW